MLPLGTVSKRENLSILSSLNMRESESRDTKPKASQQNEVVTVINEVSSAAIRLSFEQEKRKQERLGLRNDVQAKSAATDVLNGINQPGTLDIRDGCRSCNDASTDGGVEGSSEPLKKESMMLTKDDDSTSDDKVWEALLNSRQVTYEDDILALKEEHADQIKWLNRGREQAERTKEFLAKRVKKEVEKSRKVELQLRELEETCKMKDATIDRLQAHINSPSEISGRQNLGNHQYREESSAKQEAGVAEDEELIRRYGLEAAHLVARLQRKCDAVADELLRARDLGEYYMRRATQQMELLDGLPGSPDENLQLLERKEAALLEMEGELNSLIGENKDLKTTLESQRKVVATKLRHFQNYADKLREALDEERAQNQEINQAVKTIVQERITQEDFYKNVSRYNELVVANRIKLQDEVIRLGRQVEVLETAKFNCGLKVRRLRSENENLLRAKEEAANDQRISDEKVGHLELTSVNIEHDYNDLDQKYKEAVKCNDDQIICLQAQVEELQSRAASDGRLLLDDQQRIIYDRMVQKIRALKKCVEEKQQSLDETSNLLIQYSDRCRHREKQIAQIAADEAYWNSFEADRRQRLTDLEEEVLSLRTQLERGQVIDESSKYADAFQGAVDQEEELKARIAALDAIF